jgi:hypothetical protein
MKLNAFFVALIGGALMFGSCRSTDTPTPSTAAEFKCKVDGVAISTATATASLQGGAFAIAGSFDNGKGIVFTLANVTSVAPATYALSSSVTNRACAYTPSTGALSFTSNYPGAAGGSVVVTSVDTTAKKITGTFTCGVKNSAGTVSITEGTFANIPYTVTPVIVNNNSFACTIDGMAFAPTQKTASIVLNQLGINGTVPTTTGQKSVILFMPPAVAAGTYDLSAFGTYSAQYQILTGGTTVDVFSPKTGAISKMTITSNNTTTRRIVGTFYGVFTNTAGTVTANITAGSFDVGY